MGNAFEPSTWRAGFEVLPLEGTPEGGEGSNPGGVAGQEIVNGVPDKDGFIRSPTESLER